MSEASFCPVRLGRRAYDYPIDRANKEVDVDPLASPAPLDDVPQPKGKGKQAKSAYAMLEEFEAGGGEDNDEEAGGGGGLMVSLYRDKTRETY